VRNLGFKVPDGASFWEDTADSSGARQHIQTGGKVMREAALNTVCDSNIDQETAAMFTLWDTVCSLGLKASGTMHHVSVWPVQSRKQWPSMV